MTDLILTVIIRDDAPLIHAGGSPKFTSLRIELTNEQKNFIDLMLTGKPDADIDRCFLESVVTEQHSDNAERK